MVFRFKEATHLLSSLQLDLFREGYSVKEELDIKAEKGAYFLVSNTTLEANSEKNWLFVANVNQSITSINDISKSIKTQNDLTQIIQNDIDLGTKNLITLTTASDGVQATSDELVNTRHFANTLFNIMRGGIFDDGYTIEKHDFIQYISKANTESFSENEKQLNTLPESFSLSFLKNIAEQHSDSNFKRLCFEYLPLKFSRRHGDPSRPWNKFSINTRSEIDGSKILDYEGNWRDIFQNWKH